MSTLNLNEPTKLTSLNDLLALFNVKMKEDHSFELNGKKYQIDLGGTEFKGGQFALNNQLLNGQASEQLPQVPDQAQLSHINVEMDLNRTTFGNIIEAIQIPKMPDQHATDNPKIDFYGSSGQIGRRTLDLNEMLLSPKEKIKNQQRIPQFGGLGLIKAESFEESQYLQKHDVEIQVGTPKVINAAIKQNGNQLSLPLKIPKDFQIDKIKKTSSENSGYTFANPSLNGTPDQNMKSPFTFKLPQQQEDDYFKKIQQQLQKEVEEEEKIEQNSLELLNSRNESHRNKSFNLSLNKDQSNVTVEGASSTHGHLNNLLKKGMGNISPIINQDSSKSPLHKTNLLTQNTLKRTLSTGDQGLLGFKKNVSSMIMNIQQENLKLLQEKQCLEQQLLSQVSSNDKGINDKNIHLAFIFATPLAVRNNNSELKLKFKDKFRPQPLLQFKKEFSEIKEKLKQTNRNIKVKSLQGTIENFTNVLSQQPLALHFTGHGTQEKDEKTGKISNTLMLEHTYGEAETVSEEQLKKILESSKAELDFVFVASCYSEFAGKIFQNIGVKHVICVKSGNTIGDDAVIKFSTVFYQSVFSQKMTICDAFHAAVINCEVNFGPDEAGKFKMLEHSQFLREKQNQEIARRQDILGISKDTKKTHAKKTKQKKKFKGMPDLDDDEFNIELPPQMYSNICQPTLSPLSLAPLLQLPQLTPSESNQSVISAPLPMPVLDLSDLPPIPDHVCTIFGPLSHGEFEILDNPPRFHEIPQPVDNFIGRQIEVFEVVQTVMENRLVNIMGLPGIGKTALAKNSVHYLADRRLFSLGIIFFSLKGYKNCNVFMKKLVTNIMLSNFEFQPDQVQAVNEGNQEQMLSMIVSYFKKNPDDKLLVVFDNAEDLIYYDNQPFRELITQLLGSCPGLRFLLTSRIWLGVLQDIQEKIIELKELSPVNSVDLFLSRARQISDDEKWDLIKYKSDSLGPFQDSKSANSNNLANHNLFKILAGNPHAIILAAPLLIKKSLKELYMLLSSDSLINTLTVDGVKDQAVASLCLSLEISVEILEKDDHDALAFFYLIGLMPGGIFKSELSHIWKKNSDSDAGYEAHIDTLMKLSLMQLKEQAGDKSDHQKLILPPFINNYAEQTIDIALKKRFQENLCHYYAGICKDIYREDFKLWQKKEGKDNEQVTPDTRNNIEVEFMQSLRQKLLRHETNIWACIYRMAKNDELFNQLNLDKMLQEDLNASVKNNKNSMRRMSTKQYGSKVRDKIPGIMGRYSNASVMNNRKNSHQYDFTPSSIEMSKEIDSALRITKKQISSNSGNKESLQSPLIPYNNLAPVNEESSSKIEDMYSNEMADFAKNSNFDQMNSFIPKDISVAPSFARRKRRSTFTDGDSDTQNFNSNQLIEPIQEEKSHSEETNSHQNSSQQIDGDGLSNQELEKEQYGPDFLGRQRKESESSEINAPMNQSKKGNFGKLIDSLKNIMRYSQVKFNPRQSKLFSLRSRKNSAIEEEKKLASVHQQQPAPISYELSDLDILPGKKFNSVANVMPIFNQLTPSQSETVGGNRVLIKTMNDQEKLIVYYSMNLYLLRDDENALKLLKVYINKGTDLFEANIQRIMALIYLRKVDITEAMSAFKKANSIYQDIGCLYGEALTNFSMGFIYESKQSELLKIIESPKKVTFSLISSSTNPNDKALHHFTVAKDQFEHLNHKVGLALCLEHLSVINKNMGKSEIQMIHAKEKIQLQTQINKYLDKYHKRCPHVQRIYGQDISLMTEVVTDNENRDLFSDMESTLVNYHPHSSNQLNHSAQLKKIFELPNNEFQNKNLNPFVIGQLNLNHQVSAPNFKLPELNSIDQATKSMNEQSVFASSNKTDESQFLQTSLAKAVIESPDSYFKSESFSQKILNFNPGNQKQFILPQNTQNFKLPNRDYALDVVDEEDLAHNIESEKSPIRLPKYLEIPTQPPPLSNERKQEKLSPNSTINRIVDRGKQIIGKAFGTKNEWQTPASQHEVALSPSPENPNNDSSEKKSPLSVVEQGIGIGKELYKRIAKIRKNTNDSL